MMIRNHHRQPQAVRQIHLPISRNPVIACQDRVHTVLMCLLDQMIVQLATNLMQAYDYQTDLRLEKLVMQKYGLTAEEECLIFDEMNRLPNLSAVNNMKMET